MTILAKELYDQFKVKIPLHPIGYPLVDAQSNTIPVLGEAELSLKVGDFCFQRPVLIVRNIGLKCIIGADTLLAERLVLDVEKKSLAKKSCCIVSSRESIKVAPNSEKIIRVRCKSNLSLGIFDPINKFLHPSLTEISKEGDFKVVMSNPTNYPLIVKKMKIWAIWNLCLVMD